MLTYQDLLALGEDEKSRMEFIWRAINEHKGSRAYQMAVDAELYFNGENPAINRYEKIIYDMQGRAHRDMYTANHKIASSFFGFDVQQEVSYLLGNGVTFHGTATKDRLGKKFDLEMVRAGKYALIAGVSFGFWNFDHLEVFKLREFVPLYDEENGSLMAGIRFWQVADDKPLRATLYEVDGYTDYIQRSGEDMTVLKDSATIDMLKRKLYEDFQAFDSSAVSAGNQTATAIAASYTPLDLKVDDFEASVTEFILGILELAGIDDEPSYTRSKIINRSEETQTILMGADYYDDEYITKKLLTILGDADQYDELMKRKQAEEMERVEEETEFPPQEEIEVREDVETGSGTPVDG